jgi:hypothetical protein
MDKAVPHIFIVWYLLGMGTLPPFPQNDTQKRRVESRVEKIICKKTYNPYYMMYLFPNHLFTKFYSRYAFGSITCLVQGLQEMAFK